MPTVGQEGPAGISGDPSGLRLTLSSGVPATTTDVSGTTLYFTPYRHDQIVLFDGVRWKAHVTGELSLAGPAVVANTNYDVFALFDPTISALRLALSNAWSSNTARSSAVVRTNGIFTLASDPTMRLVGMVRTNANAMFEDSLVRRIVWNADNRLDRGMLKTESTASWTYLGASWRAANNNTNNALADVDGAGEDVVSATAIGRASSSNASPQVGFIGIGLDTSTAISALLRGSDAVASTEAAIASRAYYQGYPGVGAHTLFWIEKGNATVSDVFSGERRLLGRSWFRLPRSAHGISQIPPQRVRGISARSYLRHDGMCRHPERHGSHGLEERLLVGRGALVGQGDLTLIAGSVAHLQPERDARDAGHVYPPAATLRDDAVHARHRRPILKQRAPRLRSLTSVPPVDRECRGRAALTAFAAQNSRKQTPYSPVGVPTGVSFQRTQRASGTVGFSESRTLSWRVIAVVSVAVVIIFAKIVSSFTGEVSYDRRVLAELATLRFIEGHRNVILLGPVGVGKTFVAPALGHLACHGGFRFESSAPTSCCAASGRAAWTTRATSS